MEPRNLTLDDNAKKVLKELRIQSMDGYSLQSRTGLSLEPLVQAINVLRENSLVRVTGELTADAIGDSVFSVPIDVIGEVDIVLGNLRPRTSYRR